MNLNPFQSSLFTGAGLPWGPKQYGQAPDVSVPQPESVEGQPAFNRQPYVNRMMDAIYGSLGQKQAKAMGAASKLGVGRSSGTAGQLANLAAGAEQDINDIRYKAAMDTFKEQLAQKQFNDQVNLARFKEAEAKRRFDQGASETEDARRRSVLPWNIGMFL